MKKQNAKENEQNAATENVVETATEGTAKSAKNKTARKSAKTVAAETVETGTASSKLDGDSGVKKSSKKKDGTQSAKQQAKNKQAAENMSNAWKEKTGEPVVEASAEIDDSQILYALNPETIEPRKVAQDSMLENINGKYTDKTLWRMLEKGKAVEGNDGIIFGLGKAAFADVLAGRATVIGESVAETVETPSDATETAQTSESDSTVEQEIVEPVVEYDEEAVQAQTDDVPVFETNPVHPDEFGGEDFPSEVPEAELVSDDEAHTESSEPAHADGEIIPDEDDMKSASVSPVVEETALAVVEQEDPLFADEDFAETLELSTDDAKRKEELENIVFTELPSFQEKSAIIGAALAEINERNFYKATHKSFGKYVVEVFKISRPQAYQLMVCGAVYNALTNGGTEKVELLPTQRTAQVLNKDVKALLLTSHSEKELGNYERGMTKFLWEITVKSAPVVEGIPQITPSHLASVREVVSRIAGTGTIEIDGKDVPLDLVKDFADANITQETFERSQRQKDKIVEDIKETSKRRSEPQKRDKVTVSPDKPSDSDETKSVVVPKVTVTCSVHGEQTVEKFVYGGFKLTCGDAFIHVKGKDGLFFTDIIE